ncbi:hypothetical protein GCK32_010758 [Trichostrongylus colubriformis]|uniref:DUF1758 domain-containing protein n=1 Tax=Trichostrongylus colubriformis TaxID=6319 RepID=A0AAN8IQ51_TRICO
MADQDEERAHLQYVQNYGDYTKTMQEAVSILQKSNEILNLIESELARRHSTVRSSHSVNHVNDYVEQPIQTRRTPVSHSQPQTQPASMMSIVDASLLSRLDLPTFDGKLLEFPEFFSRYSTLIGNKAELDDTNKFSLLKSCLRGRALQSIQGLAITAENYHIALDILKKRYDDKVMTRHILFSQLANLPPCDPEGRNLQSLYNKMFALTRQLCAYGDDSNEVALGAILLNKLPRHIRSKIFDKTGNTHNLVPTELMHILTEIVHKEATLQEIEFHCKAVTNLREEGYVSVQRFQKFQREKPRRETQFSGVYSRPKEPTSAPAAYEKPTFCSFCDSNQHSSFDCTHFPTPQHRIQITRDKRLCFNCLSSKHRTKECQSKRSCQKCSKRHHTSLCYQQAVNQQDSNKKHQSTTNPKPQQSKPQHVHFTSDTMNTGCNDTDTTQIHSIPTTESSSITMSTSPQTTVLLMCAEVEVFNPNSPNEVVKSTAFLDSGSSASYITTELASILKLPVEKSEEISMFTFGSRNALPLSTTQHSLGIQTSKGANILSVRALQYLTNDMKVATFTEEVAHSPNLPTISKKPDILIVPDKRPDILIGTDYFWQVLFSNDFHVRSLSNGYQLIHSSIGDIITGKPFCSTEPIDYCYNSSFSNDEKLDDLLQRFSTLDAEGAVDNAMSSDDEVCPKNFNETTFHDNTEGRYTVQLPVKGDSPKTKEKITTTSTVERENANGLAISNGKTESSKTANGTTGCEVVRDSRLPKPKENVHESNIVSSLEAERLRAEVMQLKTARADARIQLFVSQNNEKHARQEAVQLRSRLEQMEARFAAMEKSRDVYRNSLSQLEKKYKELMNRKNDVERELMDESKTRRRDGGKFSADVRLPSRKTTTRPINLLCKLEVNNDESKDEEDENPESTPSMPTKEHRRRSVMTRSKPLSTNTIMSLFIVVTLCCMSFSTTGFHSEPNTPKITASTTGYIIKEAILAKSESEVYNTLCWFPSPCHDSSCHEREIRAPRPPLHSHPFTRLPNLKLEKAELSLCCVVFVKFVQVCVKVCEKRNPLLPQDIPRFIAVTSSTSLRKMRLLFIFLLLVVVVAHAGMIQNARRAKKIYDFKRKMNKLGKNMRKVLPGGKGK